MPAGFSPISALLVSMEPLTGLLMQLMNAGCWLTSLFGMFPAVRLMASVQMLLRLTQIGVFRILLRGSAVVVLFHCHSP